MVKNLDEMYPVEIVQALDQYVVGQTDAKKMIAIAIRNRARRKLLSAELREEVSPKNILMIGSTGVGKTEIARRIAKLANAPFIKVEATKYTEIGYVGRDVESMVRDLMATSVSMCRDEYAKSKETLVKDTVDEKLVDLLLPKMDGVDGADLKVLSTRQNMKEKIQSGDFDDKLVSMKVAPTKKLEIGILGQGNNLEDIQEAMSGLSNMFAGPKSKKYTIKRAREILTEEETAKLIDDDSLLTEAKNRVQEMGIIFIDEIDKIAQSNNRGSNGEVSREGVQRDILPLVEGTQVSTKWGMIDTTNILFIAAGAFSVSKPSDLIPELQGRFPIRVELQDLKTEEFLRILTEPSNAITKQYIALLKTEGVDIEFSEDGLLRIAELSYQVNKTNENIGARRLHTLMEKLLEEVSYTAETLVGQRIYITAEYVDYRLKNIVKSQDLSRYIL